MTARPHTKGSMIIMTLVFAGIFASLLTALSGFVLTQKKGQHAKENREKAIQIAEAGLDHYRWYLAHYPDDLDGPLGTMPYENNYDDPEGGYYGNFSVTATGSSTCDEIQAIDIESTGWTDEAPEFSRTVSARYARPSVAEYAYIINSNVWAGADRQIYGPYHSNGGIRMDGTNHSLVTSAQNTWLCTATFGCSPSSNQNGVFGAGTNSSLWERGVPPVDYGGITVDLAQMKTKAQTDGLYFASVSGGNPRRGYHMRLRHNHTVDVYHVTNSEQIYSYTTEDNSWLNRYERITAETYLGNYAIPTSCSLILAEDRIWLEGTTTGKITVAAADVTSSTYAADIILVNNIRNATTTSTSTHGLTAIAENNVLIPLVVPENMTLHGIFIAQGGRFGRNHYTTSGTYDVPSAYDSLVMVNSLTVHGTIMSNGREGTKWSSGGVYVSGFNQRNNTYNRELATSPPPLTPYLSDDYRFIEWHEEN